MRVIGVIDLRGGRAVHARGGNRDRYAPVETVAGIAIDRGDPTALARAYLDLGLTELYAADLDAIEERVPQDDSIAALAALGVPLCVDAGVSTVDRARQLFARGAAQVVVGLETLPSWSALETMCDACGGRRIVFSLDLRGGMPVVRPGGIAPREMPRWYAMRAAETGVGTVIVLDLARVGSTAGPDLDTTAAIRQAVPNVALLAGGGVRDGRDLTGLVNAGCDGALVATALHTARIGAAEIARVRPHSSATR